VTITYRADLSRDLSPDEVDENFRHALDSANGVFTPTGTGASAESVQTALRRFPHSSQYSSAANFNSAQAVLTGKVGLKEIRLGTGASDGVVFATSSSGGDHYSYVTDTTFNGVVDPIKVDGYNPGRPNTSEPSLYWGLEGHYFDGATHYMEWNLDYVSSDGGTSRRFVEFQVNRATHAATWQFTGSTFRYGTLLNGGTALLFVNSTTLSLGNDSPSASTRIEINGTQNAATSEFGINYLGKAGSGVTNTLISYLSQSSTVAASFTISSVQHFAAADATKGSGSTITAQWGFRTGDLTTGDTNIAFKGEVSSGSNKYNLYMDGTAQNYLAGVTGIGVAPSSTTNLILAASATGVSSLRLPHGTAPSSPVNGDIWTTTAGLFVRVNGSTVGPLS
jgi:hypothetical protein